MGETYSRQPINDPTVPFCIIRFLYGDLVTVFNADEQLVGQIKACLVDNWSKGIQRESRVADMVTFKLKGRTQSFAGRTICQTLP